MWWAEKFNLQKILTSFSLFTLFLKKKYFGRDEQKEDYVCEICTAAAGADQELGMRERRRW